MLSSDVAVKLLNVILFRQTAVENNYNAPRHYSALSFRLTSGATYVTMDGETIDACPGTISFIPEDVGYYRTSEGEDLYVFHFSLYNYVDKHIQVFYPQDKEKYRVLFEEARNAWEDRKTGYAYHATALFYQILYELECDGAFGKIPRAQFLLDGERYMVANFDNPNLSISDVSRHCGMSDAYFRRLFHEQYGVSPKQYLHTLRMQRAMALLYAGAHTQTQIAHMVGFEDVKYFRTAFKAYTGRSIREYLKDPDFVEGLNSPARQY